MVSLIWAAIAGSLGVLAYLLVPVLAFLTPIETRRAIGEAYLKMAARSFKQFTFVRRVLSGYDVLPISVDAEKKLLKVTLKSKMVGSDKEFQFSDPDNRIKRLYNKPVAIAFELVPAAIDAELAELGHWVREKNMNEGLWSGDPNGDPEAVKVKPYVEMPDHLHLVDPIDAFEIVPNSVDPENITTAVELTRERYRKYGSKIGLAETMGTIMGFAVGIATVAVLRYFNRNIMDNSGGGGLSNPIGSYDLGSGFIYPTVGPDVVNALPAEIVSTGAHVLSTAVHITMAAGVGL
jgi:hypothetical protein